MNLCSPFCAFHFLNLSSLSCY